jgi:hypothetical protein
MRLMILLPVLVRILGQTPILSADERCSCCILPWNQVIDHQVTWHEPDGYIGVHPALCVRVIGNPNLHIGLYPVVFTKSVEVLTITILDTPGAFIVALN